MFKISIEKEEIKKEDETYSRWDTIYEQKVELSEEMIKDLVVFINNKNNKQ